VHCLGAAAAAAQGGGGLITDTGCPVAYIGSVPIAPANPDSNNRRCVYK